MRRICCALILAFSFTFNAQSAEHQSRNGIAHGIGVGGTVYHTWGLGYRQYFENHWGVSANFGGWVSDSFGHLGAALGGLYTFAHHSFEHSKALPNSSIRVNAVGYLSGVYGHKFNYDSSSKSMLTSRYFDLGFGVGPGAEFFFNRHFSIHAELPWMTIFRFSENSSKFSSSHPHFGGGVNYYF